MPRKKTQSTADIAKGIENRDTFQNAATRSGLGQPNHSSATSYPLTRLTQNYGLMTSLYRNNWIVRRVIDTIPKDMVKHWVQYNCDLEPDQLDLIAKTERITRIKRQLKRGLSQGRLYGGAAGLMIIDGQDDQLEIPLELDSIMPGDFKGLIIKDRCYGVSPGNEFVKDIASPDFGLPEYYEFTNSNDPSGMLTKKVHHSRVLRFIGDELPYIEEASSNYWGASKIEAIYEELVKMDNSSWNIVGQLFLANLRVLKLKSFDQMVAATSVLQQQRTLSMVEAMNQLMNNNSIQVLGLEEELTNVTASLAGQSDILEIWMMNICGATGIPFPKLYGRSPGGLSSTGEGDEKNYAEMISQEQELVLDPVMDKLAPVLAMSTWGMVPDDFDYTWNQTNSTSEEELSKIITSRTTAIFGATNGGIISQKTALMELKALPDECGLFSNITDEDIAKADDEVIKPELETLAGEDDDKPTESD